MAIEGIQLYREKVENDIKGEFGLLMRTQKQQVGLALFEKLQAGTPVDTGEARSKWHFSSPRASSEDVAPADPLSDLVKLTLEAAAEDPLWIQNNADHIRVLEDGTFDPPNPGPSKDPRPGRTGEILVVNGFSRQAPKGITDQALDAVAAQFGLQRIQTLDS